jgi:rhodanese-related sulfurtransferase
MTKPIEEAGIIEIRREDVRRLVNVGAQLVDVLPAGHYDDEHIPGAINIPLARLGREASRLRRDRAIIVYCHDFQ